MDNDSGTITGFGALVLVVLNFFNNKSRIVRMEDKVVFRDTCNKCFDGIKEEVQGLCRSNKQLTSEVSELTKAVNRMIGREETRDGK